MKSDSKRKDAHEIWDEYLQTTSAHSLGQVPNAESKYSRAYWYILFLGLLGVGCYQSTLLIIGFLEHPVVMNIKVVNEPNLVFPSVTICNQNRLMASKVDGTRFEEIPKIDKAFCACRYVGGLSGSSSGRRKRSLAESCVDDEESKINWKSLHYDTKKKYLERFREEYEEMRYKMPEHSEEQVLDEVHARLIEPLKKRVKRNHVQNAPDESSEWIDYSKIEEENDWWGLLNATSVSNYAVIGNLIRASETETKALGHQPEDFIVQCSFDNSQCSYRDFLMFQHKRYGNCFTFNHGTRGDKLRYTTRSGSSYGLKLTLFIDQEEYIGLLTPEAGVRVTVHRPYTVPFPEDDGLDCRPGMSTTFGMRQHQIFRKGLPYEGTDCVDEATDDELLYHGKYTLLSCVKSCIQRELLHVCNCVDDINTILEEAKICDIMVEREANCVNSVYRKFENDELICHCDLLCNETYYSSMYSSTLWPSDQHEGYLFADIASKSSRVATVLKDATQTAKNVVRVNIIYMELNKEILTEIPEYEIWDLLSSLGGSMGLYVGMSVVSVFEIIGVLARCIANCFAKATRTSKIKKTKVGLFESGNNEIYENLDRDQGLAKIRAKPITTGANELPLPPVYYSSPNFPQRR